MELIFTLVFLVLVIGLIKSLTKKPKWQLVMEDVEILCDKGESIAYVEDYLQDQYGLSPSEAKLCVNNCGNPTWYQMQTFLEDT